MIIAVFVFVRAPSSCLDRLEVPTRSLHCSLSNFVVDYSTFCCICYLM